jgi:probable phosphoglycerate mutase
MRATEILLLRHGQSEGNDQGRFGGHGPTPLTEKGRRQAESVARALAPRSDGEGGLTMIWSSDLVRAVETAQPIAEACGIAVKTTPALRERSVGVFTGLTFAEAETRFPEAYARLMARDPDHAPEGGESAIQCAARATALVDEAVAKFPAGRLLFVSHAAAINLILMHVMGVTHRSHGQRLWFRTDNCALHRLRRSPDGMYQVIALNDRAHLPL